MNILLLIIIAWVWKVKYTPNSITDNVLIALILVVLNGYLWLSFPRNYIKLVRDCILGTYMICLSLFLEGLRAELTFMDRSSPFWNSSLYWSPGTSKSLSSLDQVKQFILSYGSINDQGTKESSSYLYIFHIREHLYCLQTLPTYLTILQLPW